MKPCLAFLGMLLCCLSFCTVSAESKTYDIKDPEWTMELGIGYSTAKPYDVHTNEWWERGNRQAIDLFYSRPIAPKAQLRCGLSYQYVSAYLTLYNPQPYMMSMHAKIDNNSLKFFAGADYTLFRRHKGSPGFYAGGGFYADYAFNMVGKKTVDYVSIDQNYDIDMEDSYPAIMPGFQIALGVRGSKNRLEICHWQDMQTFSVPGVPVGKQRRLGFGITLARSLYRQYKK